MLLLAAMSLQPPSEELRFAGKEKSVLTFDQVSRFIFPHRKEFQEEMNSEVRLILFRDIGGRERTNYMFNKMWASME